jgi:fructoselysine-6-P-deglycase FrlB-like protein
VTTGRPAVEDRIDLFDADIDASAEALERLVAAWQPVDLDGRSRIGFTGLGSSRYAAMVVNTARSKVATTNPTRRSRRMACFQTPV